MNREEWKNRIISACNDAGTYREFFTDCIDTLASIMEARDKVQEQFEGSGGNAVITHTNKAKQTNLTKNPLLVAMMELNAQALSYWRDLGLTPSGYKKLNADVVKDPGEGKFEELLSKLV